MIVNFSPQKPELQSSSNFGGSNGRDQELFYAYFLGCNFYIRWVGVADGQEEVVHRSTALHGFPTGKRKRGALVARINIDLWALTDVRFKNLGRALFGDSPHAQDFGRAKLERVWMHCTQLGTNSVSYAEAGAITDIENFASHALAAGLFREKDGGDFYVCGTRGRTEWLDQLRKKTSRAGKARAKKAERNPDGSFKPKAPAKDQHVAGEPSSAPTPTPTPTPTPILLNTLPSALPPPAKRSGPNVVTLWCDEYKKVYGTKYEILKKDAGILTNFGKDRSIEKVQALFACYFAIKDQLYVGQGHPLSLFFRDLAKINKAAQTGIDPSSHTTALDEWSKGRKPLLEAK